MFPLNVTESSRGNAVAPGAEPPRNDSAIFEVKVAMLEAQLERERETVDDLRIRLDRAEDRAFALTHQPSDSDRPRGFLRRLFG